MANQACITSEVEDLTKRVSGEELQFKGLEDAAPSVVEPIAEQRNFDTTIGDEMLEYIEYVGPKKMVLLPGSGVDNLELIKSARICFATGPTEYVVFARYSRDVAEKSADGTLPLQVDTSFDHTEYFKQNRKLRISIVYDAPSRTGRWRST